MAYFRQRVVILNLSNSVTSEYIGVQSLHNLFSEWFDTGVVNALKKINVPGSLAQEIVTLIDAELDVYQFFENVEQHLNELKYSTKPRARILDRAIVHMFELCYGAVLVRPQSEWLVKSSPNFFYIVPRGECLDLFLSMIKEQCVGYAEVTTYTERLEAILAPYTDQENVDWDSVYQSADFVSLLHLLFTVIFSRMKTGEFPMPALNNGMDIKHNPERINRVLKHMLAVWQLQLQQVSITEDLDKK